MTLEDTIDILGKVNGKKYVLHRDLKEASSVAKVYRNYIIELWVIDIKNPKNNLCILSAQETGQWTDRNKNELVNSVERKFVEELLNGIKTNAL